MFLIVLSRWLLGDGQTRHYKIQTPPSLKSGGVLVSAAGAVPAWLAGSKRLSSKGMRGVSRRLRSSASA